MKKALITGITGQDGYFLAKFLLGKGYEVHGFARRNSQMALGTLVFLTPDERSRIKMHWGDVLDHPFIDSLVRMNRYDEIYHLAAQSFVGLSFENPKATYDINIGGTLNFVNAIKEYSQRTKMYFAATSEMYGKAEAVPQDERTPFHPRSPYGVAKLAGFWTIKNYRESYGLYLTNGILFNHESEMRGPEFVTRKIAAGAAKIARGSSEPIRLGNLEARRDWGFAGDYVEGMWLMLQRPMPDDYVLATGENYSVRECTERAFGRVGITIVWEGRGADEIGKNAANGQTVITIDPAHFRPAEIDELRGDASKAKRELGWTTRMSFDTLVARMVDVEVARLKRPDLQFTQA
ncbi:GDP-mannose 4,6-dehydratase [Candidatus Uhrbacteria bacterium RIFCSPHIGHO2_12_FULL_60_25]|uniref:GDP-mannose 4,6-dehydratase n=1 Tax=Candidatus Uhrbacteria bacterium RIFCSPHIGHO2_12_FULL_60_25 TaxID=1802399 RepID=A0A1F7UKI2_9BACT|nr:MAG: GDP-mannose 4,6-dehydratase [Candidatus Uhrbacteria bacterium RIFCSPHIGHO2_02_FULL_60_44]OGL78755.1 MAG: GDP-mannose 4,6-dehydratase [Candidatus Uhrbacteria bacterium RIFCSPHIGHO2_12_FULL_60_25]